MKSLIIGLVTLTLISFGVSFVVGRGTTPGGAAATTLSSPGWSKGDANSSITLVEFSDFECPACAAYNPLLKEVLAAYAGELRLVYRHFPLPGHKSAAVAAYAAEAAGVQGKFFEMHDLLFERQSDWSSSKDASSLFVSYAAELGLDDDRFRADMKSDSVIERVREDLRQATELRLRGTPTFFVNGNLIENPRSLEEFKKTIDAAR